ncbi:hypothetical protein GC170_21310 [bacterium]|nr:hypothetical protein [bacterium]
MNRHLILASIFTTLFANFPSSTHADHNPAWDRFDAAFGPYGNHKKAWFFKGNKFIKYDLKKQEAVYGPIPISDAFDGMTFIDGIDAAFSRENKAWFFKGNKFIKYDLDEKVADYGPIPISDAFEGMTFTDGVDAALSHGNKAWFFKGNKVITYDLDKKKADHGPLPIGRVFPEMKFTDGVDAAFDYGDGHARFFRGKKFIKYDLNEMKAAHPATPVSTAWKGVCKPQVISPPREGMKVKLPIKASRETATWTIDAQGGVTSAIRYTVGPGNGSKRYSTGLIVEFADGHIYTASATETIGRHLYETRRGTEENNNHNALPIDHLKDIRRVYVKYKVGPSGPGTIEEEIQEAKKWVKEADKIYKELKDTDLVRDAVTYSSGIGG